MTETPSPRWYRLFQKIALVIGVIVGAIGMGLQHSGAMYAGAAIFFHGLIATLILMVEDHRTTTSNQQNEPSDE